MIIERWKEVPIANGRYLASSLGRIKIKHSGNLCIFRESHNGYLVCRIGSKPAVKVHRIIALTFLGPSELGINHKNGDKKDNRLVNIEYSDSFHNMKHAFESGLLDVRKGSRHHGALVTERQVLQIRRLFSEGISRKELCSLYGLARQTMDYIVTRKSWKHI